MEIALLPVDDGSLLVLADVASDPEPDEPGGAPVLGPVTEFLQHVAIDGAVLGVVGNATFATLAALAVRLRERGILRSTPPPGLDDVRARVADALTRAGHPGAVFTDITQHADRGWEVHGTVGASPFTARADPGGQVFQLRIG